MSTLWANQSCDPFTGRDAQCVIGTYVQYAVNVSDVDQIAKTVNFAVEKNIRLVIKNTGHDYFGKSTGAGAISVWTHNLKNLEVLDWQGEHYSGPAIRAGAGVQGFEAIQFANTHDLVAVTGSCPTVGLAGGYTQGGGHSSLASKFGLAADNALEFEVVDGSGNVLIANREENADLFWALSGGGGSTYGVVSRITVRAHQTFPVVTYSLNFPMASTSDEILRGAISSFHIVMTSLVDHGYSVLNSLSSGYFSISLLAPNTTADAITELLSSFLAYLDQNGIAYTPTATSYDSYADSYGNGSSTSFVHVQGGSWLIPRDISLDAAQDDAYIDAILSTAAMGASVGTLGFNVSKAVAGDVDNAVLEAWRQALYYALIVMPEPLNETLADGFARLETIENDIMSKFKAIAPESGGYLNEGSEADVDWKKDFFGANYDRLLSIKNKYDPHHIFYARKAVGSDYWSEQDDKRLCLASAQ
nr:RNase T2 protein [Pestalotiopsis microspora]